MSLQTYARVAGALFLISLVAGGFGEFLAPSQLIVAGDASATAANVVAPGSPFRLGFAAYLIEAMCDISLALILYVLLRPVDRELALLAAFFRLVATAVFAFGELFYFAPAVILGGAAYLKVFSQDQLNALALLSLNVYALASSAFMVFYGVPTIVFGYLVFRSGYLPRLLGVLLALSGVAFVARNFALVLAPSFPSSGLVLVAALGAAALGLWLLVRGVDAAKLESRAALAATHGRT